MKVSVVITAYNLASCIGKCLGSVLAQTHKDMEVIVVDDASDDITLHVVDEYIPGDDRVRIISHKKNIGAGWARRNGIEAATGDYVITVDGDDWLSPDFIEKLTKNAEETGADIVSGGITLVYPDGYERIERFPVKQSKDFEKFMDYRNQRIVFLNNKLVRRSMYDIVPYCTRRYCEDTPVIFPLLYYANMVSYVDTQGYYYLQHPGSLCSKTSPFEQALFKALCSKDCIKFFADKGDKYSGLISRKEFVLYLKTLKAGMTEELAEKYQSELGELTPSILQLLSL